jgi:hypothetical protein
LGLTLTVLPWGWSYVTGTESPIYQQIAQLTGKKAAKASLKATQSSKASADRSRPVAQSAPAIGAPIAKGKTEDKPPAKDSKDKKSDPQSGPFRPFELMIKDTEKIPGFFTLYQDEKTNRLLAEIRPDQLKRVCTAGCPWATSCSSCGG